VSIRGDDKLRTVPVFALIIPTLRPPREFTLGLEYFISVAELKDAPGITISAAEDIIRVVVVERIRTIITGLQRYVDEMIYVFIINV
jgi:hypothetical protein